MTTQSEIQSSPDEPSAVPPEGVTPNFTEFSNASAWYLAVPVTSIVVATFAVWIRVYVKTYIMKILHWDDCELPPLLIERDTGN